MFTLAIIMTGVPTMLALAAGWMMLLLIIAAAGIVAGFVLRIVIGCIADIRDLCTTSRGWR